MTKKEWTIFGVRGTAVVVVFACVGCLMLIMIITPPQRTGQVAVSELPSVTPMQLSTPVSATQVKLTTPSQSTSTPKLTQTLIPAPVSSPSIAPTPTPVPPSITLTPTPVPSPSVAPIGPPTVNAAEQSYRQAAGKIMTTYALVLRQQSEATNRASSNPALLFDKNWKAEVALTMALTKQNGIDLRELKPPARYTSLHADLVEMSTHFDKAIDYYAKAFDTFDVNIGEQGNKEIQMAIGAMEITQQKFDALQ